ncbi:hypothetical protein L1987_28692 [Smallanthus sonchifolius]|uniref:Uncharacterized protein n=1 Tax=Smallanthus sonchifolius TaxID=185202 RepID=A0ACB9HZQ9_9ASTR|nr:hypothetical protein L1987_28692 [Smallanthus sonchifolius]
MTICVTKLRKTKKDFEITKAARVSLNNLLLFLALFSFVAMPFLLGFYSNGNYVSGLKISTELPELVGVLSTDESKLVMWFDQDICEHCSNFDLKHKKHVKHKINHARKADISLQQKLQKSGGVLKELFLKRRLGSYIWFLPTENDVTAEMNPSQFEQYPQFLS